MLSKCFTRKITKGNFRKLHKIMITYDLIEIIFGLELCNGLIKLDVGEFLERSNRAKS